MTTLVLMARLLDDLLLQAGKLRKAHLDAEVAARHHDRVARVDDVGQILDRLGALDLRTISAWPPASRSSRRASFMSAASRGKDTAR